MANTPNLQIPHMSASDTGKYTEANTAISAFDGAYAGLTTIPYSASLAFAAFTASYLGYMVFVFTGVLTGDQTITVPSHARPFLVVNATTSSNPSVQYNLIFELGSNAVTATVSNDGLAHLLYCDGANSVYKVT